MKHHKYRLQQRKTHSAGTGFWYYRKRIPADVIEVWGAGKKEYVVSLRTRDEREAKRRAALEHDKFLSILEHKRQEKRVVKSKNQKRIDAFMRYEAYLRRMGAHPEQAPRAWDLDAIAKYRAAVEAVKYGITVEHEAIIAPDPTFDETATWYSQMWLSLRPIGIRPKMEQGLLTFCTNSSLTVRHEKSFSKTLNFWKESAVASTRIGQTCPLLKTQGKPI